MRSMTRRQIRFVVLKKLSISFRSCSWLIKFVKCWDGLIDEADLEFTKVKVARGEGGADCPRNQVQDSVYSRRWKMNIKRRIVVNTDASKLSHEVEAADGIWY